ncbi:MAG: hypothetical protein GTN80_07175 [Nitrososphaeria archaeon]|nr:hypothetical protein [Nitrososphaeria archaeon]NIQ33408.1 hypothetical protein [Nitrososphaeria archaeon]
MNDLSISLECIEEDERDIVGGKGYALAVMRKAKINVPLGICITKHAYDAFVEDTGTLGRILLEFNRTSLKNMRWEEMWDLSQRIRTLFLTTSLPQKMAKTLGDIVHQKFQDRAVVVRSSAIGEDSKDASFAGIHESYVNIRGASSILDHIKFVWASLWSDSALLYRKKLGLDIETSSMPVVIQNMIVGERSGVAFGLDPNNPKRAIIESVYGLNKGLVDGAVEPDRWILDRLSGKILSYEPAKERKALKKTSEGVALINLSSEFVDTPPLKRDEIDEIFKILNKTESLFGSPQDVEWTIRKEKIYVVQSRPITSGKEIRKDERTWYLSIRRSYENLKGLEQKIIKVLIPKIVEEAEDFEKVNLKKLSREELVNEIIRRSSSFDKWKKIYYSDFIPLAHGTRLFGRIYNDSVRPKDPYEFVELLLGTDMLSLKRNNLLIETAKAIVNEPTLIEKIKSGDIGDDLKSMLGQLSNSSLYLYDIGETKEEVVRLLTKMAQQPLHKSTRDSKKILDLRSKYFSSFPKEERKWALELLELARRSWRLRDDDNIYLARIESQLTRSIEEGKRRLIDLGLEFDDSIPRDEIIFALQYRIIRSYNAKKSASKKEFEEIKPRQLIGQPAGPGLAVGYARVIRDREDIFSFSSGEVLVCDAIDPNMTFIVPLSSAIVERRGGMLIHGAIIAREYGLPCVTGVENLMQLVKTGDKLTVDGYLGIVTIDHRHAVDNE